MEEEEGEEQQVEQVAGRSEVQIKINAAKTHRIAAVVVIWQLTMYRRKMRSKTISIQTTRY